MTTPRLDAGGRVGAGLEAVAAEFQRQLDESPDAGAAFAAVVDGHLVVDLWGGKPTCGLPLPPASAR